MSEITDIKPQTEQICPLMSGRLAGAPMGSNSVQLPGGQQVMTPLLLPCLEDRCQFWDSDNITCSILSVPQHLNYMTGVLSPLLYLEPPEGGSSPIMRIAEALEAIIKLKKEK